MATTISNSPEPDARALHVLRVCIHYTRRLSYRNGNLSSAS